jgi:adenylate cyclase
MFVDIRGYSAYAEQRAPEQVFGTVTAYTQRVSEIVMQHHGSVVEFNGDGMMAVFGAPDALDSKEREAVQAALEIAESVAESLPPAISTRHRFPIGVGIATGRAFVGHVKGLDRDIWTALGAATNRAARLQALTRELGTDVLIDEATWRRLDLLRGGFARHANMLLRGHSRRLNLYAHRTRSSDVEQVLASG